MVHKIIPLDALDTTKIWNGDAKTGGRTLEEKTRVRMGIYASEDMDELLLRTDLGVGGEKRECKAYGFREQNGTFTLPLIVSDDLANSLDDIAIELEKRMSLGKITPVYRCSDGNRIGKRV